MLYENDTFKVMGLTFRFNTEWDEFSEPPWERSDGHGPVSDVRYHPFGYGAKPPKAPGERLLYWDKGYYRTYDWAEATRIAKRDGWGLADRNRSALTLALGRAPTNGEIAAEAVRLDFKFLRDWCEDRWHYIGVLVTLLVPDEDGDFVVYAGPLHAVDALWGVEDNDPKYVKEVAYELAEGVAHAYLKECSERDYWAHRDVTTTD